MKKQTIALAAALALALTPAGCARDAESAPATTASTAAGTEEKVYCTATLEDDFEDNKVLVNLTHAVSMRLVKENQELTADDFPGVDVAAIRRMDSRSGLINWEVYVETWVITLTQHSKGHVLEMVKHIEQFDFVKSAEPNYYLPDDWLDEDEEDTDGWPEGCRDTDDWPEDCWDIEDLDDNPPTDTKQAVQESCAVSAGITANKSGSSAATPNDKYFPRQNDFVKISVPQAWNITTGSASVKVGVMDTGVANHPDLAGNLSSGQDFYSNQSCASNDVRGHGTKVAGIIGAKGNNQIGISTSLRANTFTRSGYDFAGWYAQRVSDQKWIYCSPSSPSTNGWYSEGSQPSGWKKFRYVDGATVSQTVSTPGEIVNFYAQWG